MCRTYGHQREKKSHCTVTHPIGHYGDTAGGWSSPLSEDLGQNDPRNRTRPNAEEDDKDVDEGNRQIFQPGRMMLRKTSVELNERD